MERGLLRFQENPRSIEIYLCFFFAVRRQSSKTKIKNFRGQIIVDTLNKILDGWKEGCFAFKKISKFLDR